MFIKVSGNLISGEDAGQDIPLGRDGRFAEPTAVPVLVTAVLSALGYKLWF